MAIFTVNENVKCECGCDIFTEVSTFRIVKKPNKSTLTETTVYVKEELGTKLQCTSCNKLMENPLSK